MAAYGTFPAGMAPEPAKLTEKERTMTGRERLLAEIEAKRLEAEKRKQARTPVKILSSDLRIAADETGYDPYDNPGHAKPLDVERLRKTPGKRKKR